MNPENSAPSDRCVEKDEKRDKARNKALNIALRLQGRREHSSAELRTKLTARGCEEEDISATLATLARQNWQSDDRYARALVESGARRGRGPRKIRQKLQQTGVDAETSAAQFAAAEVDWPDAALAVAAKYARGKDLNDPKVKMKLLSFMLRRGFTAEHAHKALKALPRTSTINNLSDEE